MGPYGAFGIEWAFARCFSLCATGGIAALYGQFYRHEDQDLILSDEKIVGFKDTFTRIAAVCEGSLFLRWQKRSLILQLGWDNVLLFKQNRLIRFADGDSSSIVSDGNLGLKGWQGGAIFAF